MKAKVINTGEIVEVYERYDDFAGETRFEPIVPYYRPDELDFDVPQDAPEAVTIEGYLARDANPNNLCLFERKPDRLSDMWSPDYRSIYFNPIMFPAVKWESEPTKVKITITPME